MKVLVVGGGGREHALCWKLAQSPLLTKLWCAPGNAGIGTVAECVAIGAEDVAGLVAFAQANTVDLVVVGPEGPLCLGLADRLSEAGIKVFGPSQAAAELEGSKGFMKDIVWKAGIPTAWYGRFTDIDKAKAFVREKGAPIVVKTDGLAAGKGVVVAMTLDEALGAIDDMMGTKVFGDAGNELVIEEYLDGEEASFFALCDGKTALGLVAAQDHKRVGDGDTGPNTGGMGAYSPAPVVTPEREALVMETCILPAIRTMAAEGKPYTGVLFAGLMFTKNGPRLLEFNVRFGDPECQVLMARLKSDLLPVLLAAAEGRLDQVSLEWRDQCALVVVMAAAGYPGSYQKNTVIGGLDQAGAVDGVTVLHAGTAFNDQGQVVATGGRVLGVTAIGDTVKQARERAYKAVDALDWQQGFCRRDIAWRALARDGA
ncbi:phosphoribosylamine--glycine ligase [Magnetospirillum gryphiswaldense]|uniref:Phosphoribosylamine--glycine ligase n=1 Tax=Magnetospirillum gryphiswaldense TaxID=55518 RepID=A4TU33_9PROT|nr:phosphoribosylamine--glycine ligase [Magnetospirillum gryphiswaldense]AVM75239.1 Phosphoribosylamine--glycine ligase [Magnetospirillum gryphiswaldense MSR-1]AVM79142.1 Phosphoribosylamine--glycine ligase [Magnetospirillum gryphiswaldense]CAM74140.1 Phosphoribosylglycinamide synthetase [Magnetospirillum gryphiswaldense MSR-1]